jgi:hypothetical protein
MGAHLAVHLVAAQQPLLVESSRLQLPAMAVDQFEFPLVSQVLSDSKELLVEFRVRHILNSETSQSIQE